MPILSDTQYAALARRARAHIASTYQFVTVTVTRDDPSFDSVVSDMPDEMAVTQYLDGPHVAVIFQPTPAPIPEPAPDTKSLITEWWEEGRQLYLSGKGRPIGIESLRAVRHMQAGWDRAKAKSEAVLAARSLIDYGIAEAAVRDSEPEMAEQYLADDGEAV